MSKYYENSKEFINFKNECSKTGTTEEALANAEKIGFKTNLIAINPLDESMQVPVYIANFVLMDYGFGCNLWVSSSRPKRLGFLPQNMGYK